MFSSDLGIAFILLTLFFSGVNRNSSCCLKLTVCYDRLKCKISHKCETYSLYMTCHLLDAFLLDICGTSGVFLYCFLSFAHARWKGLLLRLAVKQSQVHSVVETCLTSLIYWIKIFGSSEWCIWKWGLLISRTKWSKILLPQLGVTRINNQRIGISNASCCSQAECTICHWHGLCELCWIPADLENKSAVKSEKSKVGKLIGGTP